ncbi:MAG: hypothetical protein ABL956_13435 [Hyphomonadaceae bacterium]
MTTLARNGISRLALRVVTITLAAIVVGCAPKAAAGQAHHSAAFLASAAGSQAEPNRL